MNAVRQVDPLSASALSFVVGVLATTLFLVVVFDETVRSAALESLVYAGGAAIGVYLASSRRGPA